MRIPSLRAVFFVFNFMVSTWSFASIVHVLPIWYATYEKQWYILLGRNRGMALWTSFNNEGQQNEVSLGITTLCQYTKGRYNPRNALFYDAPVAKIYGQYFFAIPVTERLSDKLLRKARNSHKTDFIWIPVYELIRDGDVIDNRSRKPKRITVEPNFRMILKVTWPELSKKLSAYQK